MADCDLEDPMAEKGQLLAVLRRLVSPLLAELRGNLQACGLVRLTVHFADHSTHEREHAFLFPTVAEARVMLALEQLLCQMRWQAGAMALEVALERIQDAVVDQLPLIPADSEQKRKLGEVQRYLAARFGANRLRRAILSQPAAPLPEWRIHWIAVEES